MKKYRELLVFAMVATLTLITTIANANPPRVVKTIPENGDTNVDPKLGKIRIVFDQGMGPSYSICGSGPKYPKTIGQPKWINKRTLIIGVRLEPNYEYEFSVNCSSYRNFKNFKGESAVIYPVKFKTAAVGGDIPQESQEDTDAVCSNAEAAKKLKQFIDENYSYRDLRNLDWESLFKEYAPKLENAKTPREFAELTAQMLLNAKDMHIWVKINEETINPFRREVRCNLELTSLQNQILNGRGLSEYISIGRLSDNIGYIMIKSWTSNEEKVLKPALEAVKRLSNKQALIIDIRPNGGGSELFARKIAGCFITKPVLYARHIYRDPESLIGWGQIQDRILEPNPDMPTYKGKVAVLMGQANMSSCEAFLLMMKQAPNCKLIGERSYGASGNPKEYELGNGVTVWLPSWKALRPDGTCLETEGIEPDITVIADANQLQQKDVVIEAALKYLKSND
ncbi:MAG: hypothetical protein JW806_06010 [Sedimentisphaerales bacterium]|nr:hypothetical protein [Sedimentisphaerales bacterium]